MEFKALYSHNI